MTYELQGIKINCADGISQEEAAIYLDNQLQVMPHKTLLSLDLGLDGNDIIVKPHYDTIVRVLCRVSMMRRRKKLLIEFPISNKIKLQSPGPIGRGFFVYICLQKCQSMFVKVSLKKRR